VQDQSIGRLKILAKSVVSQAIEIVVRGGAPGIPATLIGVSFGKSIKGTLDIGRRATGRHEFADALGTQVLVVLTNPDAYNTRMDEVRAADKQRDLFNAESGVSQTENYTGGDERPFRRDEPGIGDGPATPPIDEHDPDDTGDLSLEPEALWAQAQKALAVQRVIITDDEAQALTEDQLTAAMFWCQKMVEDPTNGALRPKFLPAPQPPTSDDIH
jgi:hypothetical protein